MPADSRTGLTWLPVRAENSFLPPRDRRRSVLPFGQLPHLPNHRRTVNVTPLEALLCALCRPSFGPRQAEHSLLPRHWQTWSRMCPGDPRWDPLFARNCPDLLRYAACGSVQGRRRISSNWSEVQGARARPSGHGMVVRVPADAGSTGCPGVQVSESIGLQGVDIKIAIGFFGGRRNSTFPPALN